MGESLPFLCAFRFYFGQVCPYLINASPDLINSTPLAHFQALASDKDGTLKLFKTLRDKVRSPREDAALERVFEKLWDELKHRYTQIDEQCYPIRELNEKALSLYSAGQALIKSPIISNQYLRSVLLYYFQDFSKRLLRSLDDDSKSISAPYILYPFLLADILKNHPGTLVKAISIVDNDESFWPEQTGDIILGCTTAESIRVFAFRDESQIRFHIPMLKRHASRYNVYVTSQARLYSAFDGQPFDFSIIGDINVANSSLIAKYDRSGKTYKKISFINEDFQVMRQNELFQRIILQSELFDKDIEMTETHSLFDHIFSNVSRLNNKPVEMSSYISIHEYHAHEEKHAYYIQMMESMINQFKNSLQVDRPRVLEMGAGTGIFTKRLIETANIDIVAIEIDWACYHSLLENIRSMGGSELTGKAIANGNLRNMFKFENIDSTISCFNADGRIYNPRGTFDFVFSSFADHHIHPHDKRKYFDNIKKNLNPDGFFIIGDEFLPEYDENDSFSRENALRTYHNHIIEQTTLEFGKDAEKFVELESAALESGIQGLGDFKLSCSIYERHLNQAGFQVCEKKLIGPLNKTDVGGIYVYKVKKKEEAS